MVVFIQKHVQLLVPQRKSKVVIFSQNLQPRDCRTRMSMHNNHVQPQSLRYRIGRPTWLTADTMSNPLRMAAYPTIRQKIMLNDLNTYLPAMLDERNIANILMDRIDISISTSILFLLCIGINDTFEASIGIEYRQYFWKVSLTTLHTAAHFMCSRCETSCQITHFWKRTAAVELYSIV